MARQSDDFWWKNVTGPQAFVKNVADGLLDSKIILLQLPADLPWRRSMRNSVLDCYRESLYGKEPYIEAIDATDECSYGADIGDHLLKRFADRDVASSYRSKSGKSIQEYLVTNKVLSNKILWIKGISPNEMSRWVDFCQKFPSPSIDNGMFIIENYTAESSIPQDKFCVIEFDRFISRHDVQLFNYFLLADCQDPMPRLWQNYVAVAAAHLCDFDAEFSESLIAHENWHNLDPREILRATAEKPNFALRGQDSGTNHPLACIRTGQEEELTRRLWAAQVQVLFPLIEVERIQIITAIYCDLLNILNTQEIMQFGQRVSDPKALELGTLVYLLALKDPNGRRILYVQDEAIRNAIFTLRDCRNLLAHQHQCCSPMQVEFIFKIIS